MILILGFILIVLLASGGSIIREDERAAVFRLGRFHKILKPGLRFSIPLAEKKVFVHLPTHLPSWRGLSNEEVNLKVEDLVLHSKIQTRFTRV